MTILPTSAKHNAFFRFSVLVSTHPPRTYPDMKQRNVLETSYGTVVRHIATFDDSECGSGLTDHFPIADFPTLRTVAKVARLKHNIRQIGSVSPRLGENAVNFAISLKTDTSQKIDFMNESHYELLAEILTNIAPTLNDLPVRLWASNMFFKQNQRAIPSGGPPWVERGLTAFNVFEVIALYDLGDRMITGRPWISAEIFFSTRGGGMWHANGLICPTRHPWTSQENKNELRNHLLHDITIPREPQPGDQEATYGYQNFRDVVKFLCAKADMKNPLF